MQKSIRYLSIKDKEERVDFDSQLHATVHYGQKWCGGKNGSHCGHRSIWWHCICNRKAERDDVWFPALSLHFYSL